MKKVSIRQAILDAIDDSDDNISRNMNVLLKWAKYCEKSIGSSNGYPCKSALLTVTGAQIVLPYDCYFVLGVMPGDYTEELNLKYASQNNVLINVENISDDTDLEYVWGNLSVNRLPSLLWEEVGNMVNIVDEYEGNDVTLVYQFIETDEKGFWVVNESHIDAIMKFLVYKYAKKFTFINFKSSKLTRNADLLMLNEYKKDYSHAIRNARALDGTENPVNTLDKWS